VIGDAKLICMIEPTFKMRQVNAENLIARLALRRGWDNAGFEAAKAEAARIAPKKHLAEADARDLAVLWLMIARAGVAETIIGTYHRTMKFTTHFYSKSKPGASPYCFSSPTGDFDSLDQARAIAQTTADGPKMQAHSFLIESEDGKINERWIRHDGGWQLDARKP